MRKLSAYISILIAAALLLSGCGAVSDEPDQDARQGEMVWACEFFSEGAPSYAGAVSVCGEGFVFSSSSDDSPSLWLCDAESGEFRQLDSYGPPAPIEGAEDHGCVILALSPVQGGGFLVAEQVVGMRDGEMLTERCLRILDETGMALGSIDLTAADAAAAAALDAGSGAYYSRSITNIGAGTDGEVLLIYGGSVLVLVDASGQLLFCEAADTFIPAPARLADGRYGFLANGIGGVVLRVFDFERREFLDDILLPTGNTQFYPGGGDFDLSYISASCACGLDLETGEEVQLASLVNCGVNQDRLISMFTGSDGTVNCLLRGEGGTAELARIEQIPASEQSDVITLTLACMGLSQTLRQDILEFNRANSGVKIEVRDYEQYSESPGDGVGLTVLNTEIISGDVPDIFVADSLPIAQYGARGLLCDLYGLIDSDDELSRADFFENVLDAFAVDGKLYSIAPGFEVMSLVGNPGVLGPEMGWTLDELLAVLDAQPEAELPFGSGMSRDYMLRTALSMTMDEYVDWQSGECRFDGEEFRALVEFCAGLPARPTAQSADYAEPFTSGEQLLLDVRMGDFVHWRLYETLFGGELVYKGWPSSDRAGNVAAAVGDSLSISAACEDVDAAWSFVRRRLLSDYFDGERARYYPLNREAYGMFEAEAMEAEYVTDPETGEQEEVSQGGVSINGFGVDVYAMTETEAQALRELIGSVKRSINEDDVILDTVSDECSAYFSGARSLDETVAHIQDRVSTYVNEQR